MKITEKPKLHSVSNNIGKQRFYAVTKPDEQLKLLTIKSVDTLKKLVEEKIPVQGRPAESVSVSFNIPATNNKSIILVEESAENKDIYRDIMLGVRHKQRDRLISKILLPKATKNEVISYLEDTKNHAQIIESIQSLSDETDEYYNSL